MEANKRIKNKTVNRKVYNYMRKEDVVWHEEDESIVMEDADGWKLICIMNHFKGRFHYEIKTPDNYYLDYVNDDIYETIERINQEKRTYQI